MVEKAHPHLPRVEEMRAKQKEVLDRLYPQSVKLHTLIKDIQHNYTKEFAALVGTVDFAEARLAALLAALHELAEKIEQPVEDALEDFLKDVEEVIRQDTRIDEVFEKLVLDSATVSLSQ